MTRYIVGSIVLGLFCGCEFASKPPTEVFHVRDWTPVSSVQLMVASFTEANVDPDVTPDLVPDPDPEKCPCKGTGVITHGDGHKTECPYHGPDRPPLSNPEEQTNDKKLGEILKGKDIKSARDLSKFSKSELEYMQKLLDKATKAKAEESKKEGHKCRCDTSNTYCNCEKIYGKCSCDSVNTSTSKEGDPRKGFLSRLLGRDR